jgi:hypothetical protein
MLMRYHPGLGIGHVGVPNPSSSSPSQHTAGMEVDLSESVSLEPISMSPEENIHFTNDKRSLGPEKRELQQSDEEEQASEPDDQDSDHDAYSDHDNDANFNLEGDSDSLDSIGSSSIDLDEGYDD